MATTDDELRIIASKPLPDLAIKSSLPLPDSQQVIITPDLPPGYKLDQVTITPDLPAGYSLDAIVPDAFTQAHEQMRRAIIGEGTVRRLKRQDLLRHRVLFCAAIIDKD